ncbi:TetR/AcrR family transcriptional regulator [Allokutzneria oryzae]|uniref:TetR/AcrR family transcriptional regulator n=1 Tax=Allokutzneria oryzae TaxID=1378989 RepID=A0ABV5ZSY8_9PSEU
MLDRRAMRADARRNRDQILAAAHALFVAHGLNTPMEEIAKAASVGVGTLYRRFPDREALIHAVAEDTVRRLRDAGRDAWENAPDGWTAFTGYVRRTAEARLCVLQSAADPRLREAIDGDPELSAARLEVIELFDRMVERAQAEGSMRADVGAGDVNLLLSMLIRVPPEVPGDLAEATSGRFLELMLDGLRAASDSPLPGRALATADLM